MDHVLLGRQAIFDRQTRVCAYELLFRGEGAGDAVPLDTTQVTASVIVNAFVEFDVGRLIGPHRAFINVDDDFLRDGRPVPLPSERVVLEILETTTVDDEIVAAVRSLREAGFGIALDDFGFEPSWDPLLDLADVVKVDVRQHPIETLPARLDTLHGRPLQWLAEKVETREEYEALRDLGFDCFQGFFLERPLVIEGRRVPLAQLQAVRLLSELTKPDPDLRRLELLIGQDANLSHKLLRSVNSAMFALPHRVRSLREAIRLVGTHAIARWASMVALGALSTKPNALLQAALVRARTCELLARAASQAAPETYFMVGLLSMLDALLDVDMAEAVAGLPLDDEVAAALVHHTGPLGDALRCAIDSERWRPDGLCFGTLGPMDVNAAYVDALVWSAEASSTVTQAA